MHMILYQIFILLSCLNYEQHQKVRQGFRETVLQLLKQINKFEVNSHKDMKKIRAYYYFYYNMFVKHSLNICIFGILK